MNIDLKKYQSIEIHSGRKFWQLTDNLQNEVMRIAGFK